MVYMYILYVYCMCRQEHCRVQSSAGVAQVQSHARAPDHAYPLPLSSTPPHILVFIAQSSTQLSIHSLCVSSNMEGGETRVKQDRKGQSVSDRSGF